MLVRAERRTRTPRCYARSAAAAGLTITLTVALALAQTLTLTPTLTLTCTGACRSMPEAAAACSTDCTTRQPCCCVERAEMCRASCCRMKGACVCLVRG